MTCSNFLTKISLSFLSLKQVGKERRKRETREGQQKKATAVKLAKRIYIANRV